MAPENYSQCRTTDRPASTVVVSMGRLKMRDMKMRDQFAGVENARKVSMEAKV